MCPRIFVLTQHNAYSFAIETFINLPALKQNSFSVNFTEGSQITFKNVWNTKATQLSVPAKNLNCEKGTSLVAQMVKNLPVMQETQVRSLRWESPAEENGKKSIDSGYSPWCHKKSDKTKGLMLPLFFFHSYFVDP